MPLKDQSDFINMRIKTLIKAVYALSLIFVLSGTSVKASARSYDVNCNGKPDYFDLNTVTEDVLDMNGHYDVFDVMRLKNEIFKSEDPMPESETRTSVRYVTWENGYPLRSRNTVNIPMGSKKTWTVFVYMCGSNLESGNSEGTKDIDEMIRASESDNVKFVIETGGSNKWNGHGINAEKIQRYVISGGKIELEYESELSSMGDTSTLADFLKWGVSEYPAEKMGVVFWNHGKGSVYGVCFDDNYVVASKEKDSLLLREIDAAFLTVSDYMTDTFEFVGFDACLMASLETANIMATYADYMFASEENEPLAGWYYTAVVDYLEKNPGASGKELGEVIAESYSETCSEEDYDDIFTFSVTDLSETDRITAEFEKFAYDLNRAFEDEKNFYDFSERIKKAGHFGDQYEKTAASCMVDIAGLARAGEKWSDHAESLNDAVSQAVKVNKNGYKYPLACGMSVYYPLYCSSADDALVMSGICTGDSHFYLMERALRECIQENGRDIAPVEELNMLTGDFTYSYNSDTKSYMYDVPESYSDPERLIVITVDVDDIFVHMPGHEVLADSGTLLPDFTYTCSVYDGNDELCFDILDDGEYNNTEDIPRLYRRRGLFFRSVGVQSPTERKQFFELPLLVKSRALNLRFEIQEQGFFADFYSSDEIFFEIKTVR